MALVRSGKCGTAAAAKGAPRLPRSRTMRLQQAGQKVAKALAPQRLAGYEARYPCFVISLTQLAKLDQLRPHEELLQAGMLEELTRTSYQPAGAFTFFISQNWESAHSPDNELGTKLAWLKRLKQHLSIPASSEVWIFLDLISIPQKDRGLQLKAIASLPYYASLCSRFIPLVRDPDDWVALHGGDTPIAGTLTRYLKRGWCRLEAVAALCPKRFDSSGEWRPGPLNMRFRLHQSPADAGVGRMITAADLLDPREGDFHNKADRAAIEQVLKRIALEYLQYEESGATCWDTVIDVRKRPQWLKGLGEEAMAEDAAKYGDPRHLLQRAKEARAEARERKASTRTSKPPSDIARSQHVAPACVRI